MFPSSVLRSMLALSHHSQTGVRQRRCLGNQTEFTKWSVTTDSLVLATLSQKVLLKIRQMSSSPLNDLTTMDIPKDKIFLLYPYHLTWVKMTYCFPLTDLFPSGVISICELSGWWIESQTQNQTDWVSLTEAPLNYTVE